MIAEGFPFWGKRAQAFLGKSRWQIRRYREQGYLPDRTSFSEAELLACVERLRPKKRPGAAERINVPRAKAKAKTNTQSAPVVQGATKGSPQQETASQATPPEPTKATTETPPEEKAPSPAPTEPATPSGGAVTGRAPIPEKCAGTNDPHHVEFPKGRGWPEGKKAEAEKSAGDEGWNVAGDWDCSQ